jgi:transcription elongation factor Elf1
MNKPLGFEEQMSKLHKAEAELKRARKAALVQCSHQKKNGSLKVDFLGNSTEVKCKICGTRFDVEAINEREIKQAAKVIFNALQQIRSFSDREEDHERIEELGRIALNIEELPEYYLTMLGIFNTKKKNKNKNKKKNNRDDQYGYGHRSFLR